MESSVRPISDLVDAALPSQLNTIHASSDDSELRKWRKRLQETLRNGNADLVSFLHSPSADLPKYLSSIVGSVGSLEGWLKRINKPTVITTCEATNVDIFESVLKKQQRYLKVVESLFETHKQLNDKVFHLSRLHDRIDTLAQTDLSLGDSAGKARNELLQSMLRYTEESYKECAIAKDYSEFLTLYSEFVDLRKFLLGTFTVLNVNSIPMCTICTQERVGSVLVPCGHTYCVECSQKQRQICYICRSSVRERIRIYFG
jgi:hypothetical protein